MEGKGTPKNEQNQFCHSPSVKAMTPSEVGKRKEMGSTAKQQTKKNTIGHETNSGNTAAGAVREEEDEVGKSKIRECRRSSGSAGPLLDTLFCFRLNCSQRSITAMCSRTPLPLPDEHWAASGCSSAIALARCSDCKSDHPVSCAIHGPGGITRGSTATCQSPRRARP